MRFTHHDLSIVLEDEWWAEAEMAGFSPASNAYRSDLSLSRSGEPILEVRIADVGPVGPSAVPSVSSETARTGFPPENECSKSCGVFDWATRFRQYRLLSAGPAHSIDTSSQLESTVSIAHWLQGSPTFQR